MTPTVASSGDDENASSSRAEPANAPQIIETPEAMRSWRVQQRRHGNTIGFVPTMGALHTGHLALIGDAARRSDRVVVSIFVNPLQFDQSADLEQYPRTFDDDLALCARAGVAAVYAPSVDTLYPDGHQTRVDPGALATRLEGSSRQGHFTGVATVVTKLLVAVGPDLAIFGEKDAQQLAVIRRIVNDLDLGVEIVGHPTVRDDDGLALSSRNRRLSAEERIAARCVPDALRAAQRSHAIGERSIGALIETAIAVIESEPAARLDYLQIVDADTFDPLHDDLTPDTEALIVTAVWIGEIRLIDNMALTT
jgi:pantoate--beta-alanine ligase